MNLKQAIFLLAAVGLAFCLLVFFEAGLNKISFYEAFILTLLATSVILLIGVAGVGFILIYERLGEK